MIRNLSAVCILLLASSVGAAVFELSVDPAANPVGAEAELRRAILTSQSNGEADSIRLVEKGVYTLSGAAQWVEQWGTSTLPVMTEAQSLVIHGNGATIQRAENAGFGRVLLIDRAARVEIHGLTIMGGRLEAQESTSTRVEEVCGAGILNLGNLTLNECRFVGNVAGSWGGAVANRGGSAFLTITGCHFEENHAHITAGAVDTHVGFLQISDSTFVKNSTIGDGGALGITSPATVTRSRFHRNETKGFGGAVRNSSVCDLEHCIFTENSAGTMGGAVASVTITGLLNISHGEFTGNSSGYNGGAVDNSRGTVIVRHSQFTDNATAMRGGAIGTFGVAVITDTNFSGNSAKGSGGAIFNGQSVQILRSLFTENRSNEHGGGIYNEGKWGAYPGATLVESTVSGNVADDDNDGLGDGGGIAIHGTHPFAVRQSLIFENVDRSGEAPDAWGFAISGGDNLLLSTEGNDPAFRYDLTGPAALETIGEAR